MEVLERYELMKENEESKVLNLFSDELSSKFHQRNSNYMRYIKQLKNSELEPEIDYLMNEIQNSNVSLDVLKRSLTLLNDVASRITSDAAKNSLSTMRKKIEDKVIFVDFN